MSDLVKPADLAQSVITPEQRSELDREIAAHSLSTKQINQRGEIEARRAPVVGLTIGGARVVQVGPMAWTTHPDDRGARRRRKKLAR